jgi:small subunit ribosomal protein S16
MGAKKRPFYRLVVADARSPRDGRFIEAIGTYDPLANPAVVRVDAERVREWMSKGAKPTDIARQLLVREGVLEHSGPRFEKVEKAPKLSKKQVAKDRAAEEAAAQPAPEPPAAEPEAPEPSADAGAGKEGGTAADEETRAEASK